MWLAWRAPCRRGSVVREGPGLAQAHTRRNALRQRESALSAAARKTGRTLPAIVSPAVVVAVVVLVLVRPTQDQEQRGAKRGEEQDLHRREHEHEPVIAHDGYGGPVRARISSRSQRIGSTERTCGRRG